MVNIKFTQINAINDQLYVLAVIAINQIIAAKCISNLISETNYI